jgi:putative transposase
MFMLKPDANTKFVIIYCIAEAALRHGILVHAVCVMSNHIHMVVSDVRGSLPRFSQLLFNQLAKALNVHWGHTECLFARACRYGADLLVTREAIVHKIAYLLANPATANLVETSTHWPGFITEPSDMVFRKVYIGNVGKNPYFRRRKVKELKLEIAPPPTEHDVPALAADALALKLDYEATARSERKRTGKRVLGRAAVLAQKWYDRPTTGEAIRKRIPAISAVLRDARIAAILELQDCAALTQRL